MRFKKEMTSDTLFDQQNTSVNRVQQNICQVFKVHLDSSVSYVLYLTFSCLRISFQYCRK